MRPEELEKIKNMWGKARGRTIQIVDRDQMDRLTFELHNKIAAMIAHIDSQAAQIEALKERLTTETAYHLYYKCQGDCGRTICSAGAHKEEARQQLKADPDLKKAGVEWDCPFRSDVILTCQSFEDKNTIKTDGVMQ